MELMGIGVGKQGVGNNQSMEMYKIGENNNDSDDDIES